MAASGPQATGLARAVDAFDRLVRGLAYLAGALLVGIALVIVVNVVRRYVFNDPIFGVFDVLQMGMVPGIFLAMAYTGRSGAHVSVDVLTHVLPRGFWRVAESLVRLVMALAFGLIAWRAAVAALRADRYGEATNLIHLPHAPFWWSIVVGAGLSAVIHLLEALLTASGARDPLEEPAA
ncbi:MAG: TRAP transporter small permease subunit [Azospirillaceae bacterium]